MKQGRHRPFAQNDRHRPFLARDQEMLELVKANSIGQVAKHFGITRQRVHQIMSEYPEYSGLSKRRWAANGQLEALELRLIKNPNENRRDLADAFGLSDAVVSNVARALGLPRPLKPIGCERCKTDEYAKGMCTNCYKRNLRRQRAEL